MWKGADEIWNQLKAEAKVWAASNRRLPDDAECASVAETIVKAVLGSSTAISAEAVQFYGAEFCAMVDDFRRELTKP